MKQPIWCKPINTGSPFASLGVSSSPVLQTGSRVLLSGSPCAQEPEYGGMASRICPVHWPEAFRIGYLRSSTLC